MRVTNATDNPMVIANRKSIGDPKCRTDSQRSRLKLGLPCQICSLKYPVAVGFSHRFTSSLLSIAVWIFMKNGRYAAKNISVGCRHTIPLLKSPRAFHPQKIFAFGEFPRTFGNFPFDDCNSKGGPFYNLFVHSRQV